MTSMMRGNWRSAPVAIFVAAMLIVLIGIAVIMQTDSGYRDAREDFARSQAQLLAVSAATIDRMLSDAKVAAAGGRRRRAGFYSAIRREVPIRTFNDWKDPAPGFCEVDMVAHGGTSTAGSFI